MHPLTAPFPLNSLSDQPVRRFKARPYSVPFVETRVMGTCKCRRATPSSRWAGTALIVIAGYLATVAGVWLFGHAARRRGAPRR